MRGRERRALRRQRERLERVVADRTYCGSCFRAAAAADLDSDQRCPGCRKALGCEGDMS